MKIINFIFSIIFAPIRLLINLLIKPKDSLLEWHLNYGSTFVKIETNHKEQYLADDLLLASYILFLNHYFYICDKRQIEVVRNLLKQEINKIKPEEISTKILKEVEKTFNKEEIRAMSHLFAFGIPPLGYSESDEPNQSYAKYNFFVFKQDDNLRSIFHMSAHGDLVFLPITVGILYEYIINKLRDENKKDKLNKLIVDLLEKHLTLNCRSIIEKNKIVDEVIKQNNINY